MTDAKQPAEAQPQAEQEATEPKPAKRNRDGLVPGQSVDFDTIRRVEAERAKKARK